MEVKRLNEQVRRNMERFPEDFMFQLTPEECLRSQIATLNTARGQHLKYMLYAFTEYGIAMLIGASIKDLGKRWFGFTLMENTDADDLISRI